MRKRTIRKGLRLVLAALILIIMISYYNTAISSLFTLPVSAEEHFYTIGIFAAAATGGYGVVLTVFGLVLSGDIRDNGVRLLPVLLLIVTVFILFFYLLISSLSGTSNPGHLRPGDTITI